MRRYLVPVMARTGGVVALFLYLTVEEYIELRRAVDRTLRDHGDID